jgi:LytS/YehU family sensor histidine kinase
MSELEEDGKVGLEVEIEQLKLIIEIIKLRFRDLQMVLNIDVNEQSMPNYRIPPQVIVSLAENIFKYGLLNEPDKAAMIAIQEKSGLLHVAMSNWKALNDGSVSGKIGLDLVQKRLKNIYGNAFSLKIDESPDFFKLKLIIQL